MLSRAIRKTVQPYPHASEQPLAAEPARNAGAKGYWVAGYGVAAVLPLGAALVGSPPSGRGFAIELASGLGIVALSLLALQLALPSRVPAVARALGAEVAVRLHRHLADVLVAALAAHVALVIVADPANVALLDPLGSPWRAKAAVASCAALAGLIATSLLRGRLRLPYARWRGVHVALGVGALAFGVAHAVGVDRYLTAGPAVAVTAALAAVGLLAVVELRLLRPRRLAARPYVVERIVPERGGATTLALRADGHGRQRFRPGQFAWLKLADAPHALAGHPFSYSSSATCPEHPAFTIKAYQGFSRDVPELLRPGTRVLLDGPHGSYRPRARADRFVPRHAPRRDPLDDHRDRALVPARRARVGRPPEHLTSHQCPPRNRPPCAVGSPPCAPAARPRSPARSRSRSPHHPRQARNHPSRPRRTAP